MSRTRIRNVFCLSALIAMVPVLVNPVVLSADDDLPVPHACSAEISGSTTVCNGSDITLLVTNIVGIAPTGYTWSQIGGTGSVTFAPSNAVSTLVTGGTPGTVQVQCVVVGTPVPPAGCNTIFLVYDLVVNANPVCSITGASAVCANSLGNNYTAPGGMSTYAWSISGNGTINGSASSGTVIVDAGAAGSYTLSLTITDGNGCSSTCNKIVTVNANPTCSITGPDPVCEGTTNSYSGTGGMSSYSWSISGNGSIVGLASNPSVSVLAGAAGSYTLTLTIFDSNGCTSTCNKIVTVQPLPNVNISHNAGGPLCPNWAGYVASVPAITCIPPVPGFPIYAWSISAGGTIVGPSNQASVSFKVDTSNPTVTLSVTVTGCNGCSNSNSVVFNVCQLANCQTGQLRLQGPLVNVCYKNNDMYTINVYMDNVSCPTAGFQAFLKYDSARLQYIGAGSSYTSPLPFGLVTIPINDTIGSLNHPVLGKVNLSSGVNVFGGQLPVTGTNILLATLQFKVISNDGCDGVYVDFRPDPFVVGDGPRPPTRLTDLAGFGFGTIAQAGVSVAGLVVVPPASIRIDGTAPLITAPAAISTCYPSVASAEAAAIASAMAVASDNCTGVLTPSASTVGTCSAVVSVTVADGCGNISLPAIFNTRIDNTAPVVGVPAPIAACYPTAAAAAAAAEASAIAASSDNCPGLLTATSVTVGDCSAVITVTVKDGCNNAAAPVVFNTRIDNTAPVISGAGFATGFEVADGFVTAPGRSINFFPENRSANGQSGWFVEYGGTTVDEEISTTGFHGGSQSWRISNWYSNGIVTHASSPGLATPAGEAGTTNAALVPAGSSVFRSEFYWKTASATPDESIVQISPDGGSGSRWGGRLDITNFSTAVPLFDGSHPVAAGAQLHWNTIVNDTDSVISSPVLLQNTWYRTIVTISFVPGVTSPTVPNDIVTIQTYSPTNTLVWNVPPTVGVSTWELAGYGGPSAVDRLVWRTKFNTSHVVGPDGYSGDQPKGFYFDDLNTSTAPATIASCYANVAAAEAAAKASALAAALDNCTGPLTASASTVGDCAAVVSVTVADGCGNVSLPTLFNTRIDNTAPVAVSSGPIAACYPTIAAAQAAALANSSATDNCPGLLTPTATPVPALDCSVDVFVDFTDGCGNSSNSLHFVTRVDNTPPTITAPAAIGTCYPTLLAAETAAKASALAAATDLCSGPLTASASTVGTCSAVVSVTVADGCGNISLPAVFNTRIDNTPPVITCPANVVVTPPLDSCTAVGVNPGTATATDNCPGLVTVVGVRSDLLPLSDPYPHGVTTITWTATDSCGNSSNCPQTVTVNGVAINVAVELSPTISPLPLNRCITFEVFNCPNPTPQIISQVMTFTYDGINNRALATGTICVPLNQVTCVTARDKLHTLRSRVDNTLGGGLTGAGPNYAADFTGKRAGEPALVPVTPGSGHRLVGGNLNDDEYIDILDFGTWAGLYNTAYPGYPGPTAGYTTCSTASPHADISGDGFVDSGDFSFIALNFLMFREANCCGLLNIEETPGGRERNPAGPGSIPDRTLAGPLTRISVEDLRAQHLDNLIAGDINRDGWLDMNDVVLAWIGLPPAPSPAPPVPVGPSDPVLTPNQKGGAAGATPPSAGSIQPQDRKH